MKALLIGGTGTISLSISRQLLALGWELTVLNRGSAKDLLPGAEAIACDMADEAAVRAALQGRTFDVVAQFIAYTPDQVERDIRLFSGMCGQYIFISSASAYHKPPLSPLVTESVPLHNPWWAYSRAKADCEEVLMRAYRLQGFPVTIVRPSHTYYKNSVPVAIHGKNGSWQVIDRIRKGKPVLIPGDGTTLWTLTWAEDFAPGFIGLMGNIHAIGEAVHITSDQALTWNQAHQVLADALGVKLNPCHVPSALLGRIAGADYAGSLLGDKANCAVFDNTKLKRLVPGFHCPTRFDQGARMALENILATPALQREDPAFDALSDKVADIMSRAGEEIGQLNL